MTTTNFRRVECRFPFTGVILARILSYCMKTPKRVKSTQLSISLPAEMAKDLRAKAEAQGVPVSELIKKALDQSWKASSAQQVDLRDVGLLLDSARTIEEFKDLLNNTMATDRFDWEDPLPPPDMTPKQRTDYLKAQVARRLTKLRAPAAVRRKRA
jgi:hypothetical protein